MKLRLSTAGLLVGSLAACAASRPTSFRTYADANPIHCIDPSGPVPEGVFTIWIVTSPDGTAPVAFIHDAIATDGKSQLRCFANMAHFTRLAPSPGEWVNAQTVSCESHWTGKRYAPRCAGGEQFARAEQPLDPALARDTLDIAEWATPLEKAWGEELAGLHAAALADFQLVLASAPDDPAAVRGLAMAQLGALDLPASRASAEKAVGLAPDSSAAHEALLRVCLAQADDACTDREAARTFEGQGHVERQLLQLPLRESIALAQKRLELAKSGAKPPAGTPDATPSLVPISAVPLGLVDKRHLNADARGPVVGTATNPLPVVFLPDLGGGVRDFHLQLERLSSARRVVALEPPGIGFSDEPMEREYAKKNLFADLLAALERLELRRFVLVGHGLGATLAAAFAAAHPERVAGLLLVEPWGDLTRADEKDRRTLRKTIDELSVKTYLATYDLAVHPLLDGAPPSTRELVLREVHMLREEAAAGFYRLASDESVVQDLSGLRVPIEMVESDNEDEPFALSALLPLPARHVATNDSWLMLDAADEVNAALDRVLAAAEAAK